MCEECGCGEPEKAPRETQTSDPLGKDLLSSNDRAARHNREHLRKLGSFLVHLTSSPGSGKTSLLEATVGNLKERLSVGVIEGDVATENDAKRMEAMGIPSQAITTDGACHLSASQVHHAMHHLTEEGSFDLMFVENVGNLVCPADFDLGEDQRVVLISVTEGDDKPEKYPPIFRNADVLVISKTDLLPHVDFDVEKCKRLARTVAPRIRTFELSAKNGEGIEEWTEWLLNLVPGK